MQSAAERRYWAERRKRDRRAFKVTRPKQHKETVLLATSHKEYDELRQLYPGVKIRLEINTEQQQLFNAEGFKDA